MNEIFVDIQGIKGGRVHTKKIGQMEVYADNKKIIAVDNYSGFGSTYTQRDEPIIVIYGVGSSVLFSGSYDKLKDILLKS